MEDLPEQNVIRIPRPRSILRQAFDVLQALLRRGVVCDRGNTITAVTEGLSDSGRSGTVISYEPGAQWSVTLVPDARPHRRRVSMIDDEQDARPTEDVSFAGTSLIPYRETAVVHVEADCGADLELFLPQCSPPGCVDLVSVLERTWIEVLKTWQRLGALDQPRRLLFQTARVRAYDWHRRHGRRPPDLSDDERQLDAVVCRITGTPRNSRTR